MTRRMALGLCLSGALLTAGAALAHHGWGEYDATKPFTISGALATVSPGNPHVTVGVMHDGKAWTAVLAPPSRMSSRGLPADSLKAGVEAVLLGYPAKDGKPEMRAERITIAGKTVELR